MAIKGTPRSFYKKFKFTVEEKGITWAGFRTCSDLRIQVAKIEQREGGALIPNKSPGLVTVPDVTLARGATADKDLWDWMKEVVESGSIAASPKRQLDIVQHDRRGLEIRRWQLVNCWPIDFKAGDWDNEADENVIEEVILALDYFTTDQDFGTGFNF